MDLQRIVDKRDKIGLKMIEDKDFCLSIMNCKDRNEVKTFLKSNGIEAGDDDVEDLAKNIAEVADICKRVDEDDLEKVVGGKDTSKVWGGIGIGLAVTGGLGILLVVASWIKKKGDERGWWTKKKS